MTSGSDMAGEERLERVGRSLASSLLGPEKRREGSHDRAPVVVVDSSAPVSRTPATTPSTPFHESDVKQAFQRARVRSPPQRSTAGDAHGESTPRSTSAPTGVHVSEDAFVKVPKASPSASGAASSSPSPSAFMVHAFSDLPWPDENERDDAGRRSVDLRRVFARSRAEADTEPDSSREAERSRPGGLDWPAVVVAAFLTALVIRLFVFATYSIPSESMYPTLQVDDRVVVNKLSYKLGGVGRGDLVVFERPESAPAAPGEPTKLIKRVIGLPGESVEARGGDVFIDGEKLEEDSYLDGGIVTNNLTDSVEVPEGELFVMGDNRERSQDSRFIGTVPESSVVGRAVVVVWPLGRAGGL